MSAAPDDTVEAFRAAHPRSEECFARQSAVVPGGITHRSRYRDPFPLFVSACEGAYKDTVDGRRLIDYWMGHGALLFGNADPATAAAVSAQAARGFHAGGETAVGARWAELVCALVPCAERVRFVASGGEATQLAVRLARVATGRRRILAFRHCFHGWSDQFAFAHGSGRTDGVPESLSENIIIVDYNDLEAVERQLGANDDIAAVILEPAGAFNDTVPVDPEFLRGLRGVTREHGVLLVFDEVVSGFRYAPGGAQEYFGVTPDLTTLGKVVSGGMSAGAVAGRAELLDALEVSDDPGRAHIPHSGTWNANPMAAAAGAAMLEQLTAPIYADLETRADKLRNAFNDAMRRAGVDGVAYGRSSIVKLHFGGRPGLTSGDVSTAREDGDRLMSGAPGFNRTFDRAMVLEGVDWKGTTGFVSTTHGPVELEETAAAFERALARAVDAVGRPRSLS